MVDPSSLALPTFQEFDVFPDGDGRGNPTSNLAGLNEAINWSSVNRQPVYGCAGTYTIDRSPSNSAIVLQSNAKIICLPGCTIAYSYDPGGDGVLNNGRVPLSNASWTGGRFLGRPTDGLYPEGFVIDIAGNDLLFRDVTIDGFYKGCAMAFNGDRITDNTRGNRARAASMRPASSLRARRLRTHSPSTIFAMMLRWISFDPA